VVFWLVDEGIRVLTPGLVRITLPHESASRLSLNLSFSFTEKMPVARPHVPVAARHVRCGAAGPVPGRTTPG